MGDKKKQKEAKEESITGCRQTTKVGKYGGGSK